MRLKPTLEHLAALEPPAVPWEVLLVDNASTDGTAEFASELWRGDVRLHVLREERLGLTQARESGLANARHNVVAFVDDDNWLASDWLQVVLAALAGQPRVAAVGGLVHARPETSPPSWFPAFQHHYACGPQASVRGPLPRGHFLFGAGLAVRRDAWEFIGQSGFRARLSDRRGAALSAGGDVELCFALQCAGWQLAYEPDLLLGHFLPSERLTWGYVLRLAAGNGEASTALDPYLAAMGVEPSRRWASEAFASVRRIFALSRSLRGRPPSRCDGKPAAVALERDRARLGKLLRDRRAYDAAFDEVLTQVSRWRR